MQNQLTITPTPSENEYLIMRSQAESLVKSGFLPSAIKTPEQALAIILTGRELGIPAMAALNTINVIQGKPTISPQLMLALIKRSNQLEDIRIDQTKSSVTVTMKRKGNTAHSETFGTAEAMAMGLSGKDNYKKQPQVMFKWRALSACSRVVFPDIILGLYTHEEMGADTDLDGELTQLQQGSAVTQIEGEISPSKPFLGQKPTPAPYLGENPSRGALIGRCGHLFRALNSVPIEPKFTGSSVTEFINERYRVSGGIEDLLDDDLENLAEYLHNWYTSLTDEGEIALRAI